MCIACGNAWPWAHPVQVAKPPVQEEHVYLDSNPSFYPDYRQGIHPPAPVYTANQPAPQSWYYYGAQQQSPQPQGYWVNGQFYPTPSAPGMNYSYYYQPSTKSSFAGWTTSNYASFYSPATYLPQNKNIVYYPGMDTSSYILAPSGPTVMQMPACPATMTAQAATAAATNAALAAMPQNPGYYVGNPMDYATQQAIIAAQVAQIGIPKPPPTQLAPYKPADGQQFWCKELDGSWTLRTHTDIVMGEVSPGHWERHATSGYFYWVRSLA